MSILFVGGEKGDFTEVGAVEYSTVATYRDGNYTRGALRIQATSGDLNHIKKVFTGQADLWLKFRMGFSNASNTNDRAALTLASDTGNLFRVAGTGTAGTFKAQRWSGAAWADMGTFTYDATTSHPYVVRARIGVSGGFDLYKGGALVATYSGDTSSLGNPTSIDFSYPLGSTLTYHLYLSEFIGATHDIREARLETLDLTGAGSVSQWTGALADINAGDSPTSSFISEDTAGEVSTFLASDIHVDSLLIDAVVVSGTMRRNATGPTGIDGIVRVGSTNYGAAMAALTESFELRQAIFAVNPATSAQWAAAEVDALEIGVRAAA